MWTAPPCGAPVWRGAVFAQQTSRSLQKEKTVHDIKETLAIHTKNWAEKQPNSATTKIYSHFSME